MTDIAIISSATGTVANQRERQQADAATVRPTAQLAQSDRSGAATPRLSHVQCRNLLLGGVAMGAALMGYGRIAHAACATDGTTIACTGDLSAGVAATNPATTLNINSLIADIAPAAGVDGISFTSTGDLAIVSDTGAFEISVSGAGGDGILASSSGAGAVSVTHTGDITSDASRGIFASSNGGGVTILSRGTIKADDDGIEAQDSAAGAVSITHTGDITSDNNGINAHSTGGGVTILSKGTVTARNNGIQARDYSTGAVSLTHTGDIISDIRFGIFATSNGGGVAILTTGNIQGSYAGITTSDSAAGAVSVTHTGDITASAGEGISASSNGGGVTILSRGTIKATSDGIRARDNAAGAVSVTHTGDIFSGNSGINASSTTGGVTITLADGVVRGAPGAIQATSATGTTLNLNAGSVLIGGITIGGAGAAVLNTGPGLSISHTFTGTVPTIGNVSGNVSAVSGNQIAVADISSLAAADNQLSDTLDGLSGVLDMAHDHGKGQWWISGFGGVSDVDGSSSAQQADHSFGGLAAGGHTVFGNGMLIGVFGGLSKSVHQADVSNGARTEGTGFFGGLYGGYSSEAFALDFTLTAGNIRNNGTRIVANNTVATGFEKAKSSHDSFFIAPELTLSSMPMAIGGVGFTPSLRVRYELQKSGSFAETGLTSGALTMGSATSHALNLRLQGAFPVALNDPASTLTFRTGIDARFATESGRQATLLGVVTNGAGAGNESSGSGFAGFDFSHALSNTATLLASGELQAGTTGLSAVANFGIRVQF